ncbi:MAG: S46 family peptidase, partial [Flavobacteriales bacterium]|nr:S46 family peptidase [Flavobacteriales bacterium]
MHRSSNLFLLPLLLIGLLPFTSRAHEGMWLPTLLKAIEGDMRTEGLQITAEDIYSINRSSLKDAVVLFGGGCTAEVVSTQGLIFTNHHCGHSTIQQHSTLEHNYLRDGFVAATLA